MNTAETILHSQHTSSHWLHLHLWFTCCVSLMIFEKFLAASLLSSAHIALSESLPFSLSLFLSFILHRHHPASCFLHRASCMVLPACSWLTIALILTASPHACRLFGFRFFFFGLLGPSPSCLPSFLFFYLEFPSSPPALFLFTLPVSSPLFSSFRSLLPVP